MRIAKTTIKLKNGEFHVRAYGPGGQRMPNADYFTDDLRDANATAATMVQPDPIVTNLSRVTFLLDNEEFAAALPVVTAVLADAELREMQDVTIPANVLLTLLCAVRAFCDEDNGE